MLLGSQQIRDLSNINRRYNWFENQVTPMIDPLVECMDEKIPQGLWAGGYTLRIAQPFDVYSLNNTANQHFIDTVASVDATKLVISSNHEFHILQPGYAIHGTTVEKLFIPKTISALLHPVEAITNTGLQVSYPGRLYPGYYDKVYFRIINMTANKVKIHAGKGVLTTSFILHTHGDDR